MIAVIGALAAALIAYLLSSRAVRRDLLSDQRSDDPLRRAYALDRAAVGQVTSLATAVAGGIAGYVGLSIPDLVGALLVGVFVLGALTTPVAIWEHRRLRQIRG